jgi:Domain of unknown function (DUF4365)
MLTIPHCKESLSRAYVTAVVGRSRHKLNWNSEFDYGIDGYVRIIEKRGIRHSETGLGFDFQSKTTTKWTLEDGEIVYDLEADAYNDLASRAGNGALPFLLVLLCIPKDEAVWLDVSEDRLVLQKCAYWLQLDGVVTSNEATKRIRIPVANVFTPSSVSAILQSVKSGEMKP